ncbi:MAG TPA: HesA/MoeB/ThiF family protein [Arsenicitalea sp.]|jgi:molybdopterin/thiamine biosynthesis adenylyltransferase|nr:HesA/MoeB/ThiF family protein [Arsenicitalea sp.]
MTDRYARQRVLPEVGDAGQARIEAGSVLVVGAGGLGCPVLQYLAGAGVGRIYIIDPDTVEETNLHRQPLYGTGDIGTAKADAARSALLRLNPGIFIKAIVERLTPENVARLVAAVDIVVDAADNFAATYILSDACRVAGKPLVSASAIGLSGYVGAFCGGGASYRAVFPEAPRNAGNCATVGVLGSVVAVLGGLQAQMVLQLLLDLRPSVLGRMITFDGSRMVFGGFGFGDSPEPAEFAPFIPTSAVAAADLVVDLRGLDEAPISPFPQAERINVDGIEAISRLAAPSQRIVLCCRSGQRALQAASRLREAGHYHLALVAFGD